MDMDSSISHQLAYSGFLTWRPALKAVEGMERRALKRAARVVTVCRSLSDRARELWAGAEIRQIEDAPLTERFDADEAGAARLREELELGERPCVVYTGNFEAYQGVELLVDAMVRVGEVRPEAVAVLAGGEPRHREVVATRICERGLEQRVKLAGERPMAEMPAFLTLAAVLAAPRTRGTNTALKVYGYMQTGRPIVATRLETHTQVLDDSSAWLTDTNAEAFAEGLIEALERPEEAGKRGAESRRRVEELYGLERFERQVRVVVRGIDASGGMRGTELGTRYRYGWTRTDHLSEVAVTLACGCRDTAYGCSGPKQRFYRGYGIINERRLQSLF